MLSQSRIPCFFPHLGENSLFEILSATSNNYFWRFSRMKIRPLSDRILVKRLAGEEKTASGIIIPDNAKEKPMEGQVIAVGAGKALDDGKLRAPDVRVGDRILFSKYAGSEVKLDGIEHLILREDDILGVIS
jgi:chaperonin GroES